MILVHLLIIVHQQDEINTIKQLIKLGFLEKPLKRKNGKRKQYKYSTRKILLALKQQQQQQQQYASSSGHMQGSSSFGHKPPTVVIPNTGQEMDAIKKSHENEMKALKDKLDKLDKNSHENEMKALKDKLDKKSSVIETALTRFDERSSTKPITSEVPKDQHTTRFDLKNDPTYQYQTGVMLRNMEHIDRGFHATNTIMEENEKRNENRFDTYKQRLTNEEKKGADRFNYHTKNYKEGYDTLSNYILNDENKNSINYLKDEVEKLKRLQSNIFVDFRLSL